MDNSETPTGDAWRTFCQRLFCSGWYYWLQVGALAGSAVAWVVAGSSDLWVRVPAGGLGIFCIGMEVWFAKLRTDYQRDTLAEQEEARRAPLDETVREFSFFLESVESPLLGRVLRTLDLPPGEAESHVAGIEGATLSMAMNVCGPRDVSVRALLFRRDRDILTVTQHVGGQRKSQREFPRPTPRMRNEAARRVWEDAAKGEPVIYNDLINSPPAGFTSPNSDYRAFMTCGILDEAGEVVGMLNVDCPIEDGLSDADAIMLRTLCETLAIAYGVKRLKATHLAAVGPRTDIQLPEGPANELA